MVVDVEEAPVDGIPLVDGMDPDELKLYHKLKKKSSIIYQEILEATREMKKYELSVTKIMCRSDRIYVYIGNVCVSLGNDVTSVKVAQIPKILEKLEGKEGTLHLENFSDESDTATFDIGVFPEDAGYNEMNRQIIENNAKLLDIPITVFESDIFDEIGRAHV